MINVIMHRGIPNTFPLLFLLSFCAFVSTEPQVHYEDEDSLWTLESDSDCLTPQRQRGRCVPWTTCGPLNRITRWDRIRPYTCGFSGNEPLVCCPNDTAPAQRTNSLMSLSFSPSDESEGESLCGNSSVDEGEECDAGGGEDHCCDGQCKLKPGAVCSDKNSPCCLGCHLKRGGNVCRESQPLACRTEAFCTGFSQECPRSRPLAEGTRCIDGGTCYNGECIPFCELHECDIECGKSDRINATSLVPPPEYPSPGDWPWTALVLVWKGRGPTFLPKCSGALVSDRLVITAASCIVTENSIAVPLFLKIRLGGNGIGSVERDVHEIRIHENFDPSTYKNDIAVLKLSGRVAFIRHRIRPVCLPRNLDDDFSQEVLEGRRAVLTGYGTLRSEPSNVLQEEESTIHNQGMCERSYEKEINITMEYLCAGIIDGSECKGDSGSPLVTPGKNESFYLTGILSYGKMCGQPDYPQVYTRVSMYLDWLTHNMAQLQ